MEGNNDLQNESTSLDPNTKDDAETNGNNEENSISDTCDLDNQLVATKSEHELQSEETANSDFIEDVLNEEDLLLQRELLLDGRGELAIPTPETMTDDGFVEGGSNRDAQKVVTVKFRTDTNETVTSAFMLHSQIGQVKERLAGILKINFNDITLSCQGNECEDDLMLLSDLGAEPLRTIELGIHSTNPSKVILLGDLSHYIPVVDVITVRVSTQFGGFKDVVVEIENQCTVKEWLGGFRHRITKIEYHHAAIQTLPRKRPPGSLPQLSRAIQTPQFPLKDISVNTNQSRATQVSNTDDEYIPNIADRIVTTNSDRFQQKSLQIDNVPQIASVLTKATKNFRLNVIRQKEQRKRDEKLWEEDFSPDNKRTENAVFPLKRSDFYLLYLLIGKWWRKEMSRIARTKNEESRSAALLSLLDREVSLLSAIEQQRIQAKKVNWLRRNIRFLEMTARPIIFRNDKGVTTWIDTIETQQAREYQEIITSFMNTNVTKQQRIDVINKLKTLINGYNHYDNTYEIINLLERENQLLMLGMKNNQLTGLRERVLQLLIDFFHRFVNDTNKSINLAPQRTSQKKTQSLHCCAHCNKLKPPSDYNVHVKMTSFNTCRSCEWMKNIGNERIDLGPYSRLLSQVRQSEMQNCSYSSVCYVLQVVGMYYLVHHIWCCKSILSDVDDMNELRMVRFRKEEDWSPWNCILLTTEESKAHLSIPNVHTFYGRTFLEQIQWKHQRAKNHFFPLLLNDKSIRDNNVWSNMADSRLVLNEL